MAEFEETWTEQSFYDKPLAVWLAEEGGTNPLPLDIFTAASIGCCQRVKDIITEDKNACNQKNIGGWTALMYAAYYGHCDTVRQLLGHGASLHIRNHQGCSTLMLAAVCGSEAAVEMLIKAGSILETRDCREWTALFHAVHAGQRGSVHTLLRHRANANACERESGMTPLMHAARLGDAGTVEVLLRAGASTTLTNHQGHTAARVAQDAGFPGIAATITQWAAQGPNGPSLLDGPATLEAKLGHSMTPKSRAATAPSVDNASVQPTDLETLLDQVGLSSYLPVFHEQDVDLQIFLTLTDQDLKECGIQKLGPRRKMTSAIARWHSNAPLRSTVECAYADKLEVEMQELGVKLTHTLKALEQAKSMVSQESDLRSVTEGWVVEARKRLHQCYQHARLLSEQVVAVRHCVSLLSAQVGLVQPPHGQPSLIATAMDTLAAQVDSLLALTDPNIPRGPKNASPSKKQHGHVSNYLS
ncbi:ankyrin repeat and SAM domain-containing protein 3-like [Portunus trituberculatus]|uniref:ankyrin repeat and SAM domain-containing protein 3-like n=1 Tax=Portunus trituberculatus TaxID=210409 RepID=UPI001E1D047C|nr:ankyrin repeat and SAM domain-containing protein 3-like [Portunus trituberculatus]XP_045132283.1 ankyrin repeat and SAM domain-containing protein 3-like [Portunus trituberculatus]